MIGDSNQQIKIERPLYEQERLHDELEYHKSKQTLLQRFCADCKNSKPKKLLYKTVPILDWLSHYKWKEHLSSDLVAGFTVAIMHIPQGMGYAMLGNVPPIVGIYMAFFPVLMYIIFGTSKHNSLGTFAIICLMTGKVILKHSDPWYFEVHNANETQPPDLGYSPVRVATATTFLVAVFQLMMYGLRLGMISNLVSETMVSGFITGSAIHVFTSQITDLLGYNLPKHKGMFPIVNIYMNIFKNLFNVNYVTIVISALTMTTLVVNNEVIKPRLSKLCFLPLPIELIILIIGSLVSNYVGLRENFEVKIIGIIPRGLPPFMQPEWSLMNSIVLDSLIIAIVSYTINLSLGLIFAQKYGYEVDANQELFAQGAGNLLGSFFSCMPFTASLSRSVVQTTVGGKTQLTSLVSCSLLVFVLIWIGPFFEPLPKSILASIIIVALKGMLMQVKDFIKFYRLSKLDAAVWMITFLSVVLIEVDIGLLIGFIMSLLTIFFLSMKPYTCLLGSVPQTDLYLDINRYKGAQEIMGLKIFHYQGGINFATKSSFKNELFRSIEMDPQKELILRKKLEKLSDIQNDTISPSTVEKLKKKHEKISSRTNGFLRCLILDFSALSYIDPSGVSMIGNIYDSFKQLNIPVYIAGCSAPVYEVMTKCGLLEAKNLMFRIFPTTHDAVQCALATLYVKETTLNFPE